MNLALPIMESFHSLQGEGAHAGTSAFFIRLAGCNVKCSWCDTKESWSSAKHPEQDIYALAQDAETAMKEGASFLVITGGEPLEHNLNPLCHAIKEKTSTQNRHSMPIHLETSGVNAISGNINWITLSPKKHMPPKKEILEMCHEIKVIVHNKEDLTFAKEIASKAIQKRNVIPYYNHFMQSLIEKPFLFLQPGWRSETGKQLSIAFVKQNPEWRLSMQTHKWLGVN